MNHVANASIDKDGRLWLIRAGKSKLQFCPFDPTQAGSGRSPQHCGDQCPLFETDVSEVGNRRVQLHCGSGQAAYWIDRDDRAYT